MKPLRLKVIMFDKETGRHKADVNVNIPNWLWDDGLPPSIEVAFEYALPHLDDAGYEWSYGARVPGFKNHNYAITWGD